MSRISGPAGGIIGPRMTEVTRILSAIEAGDPAAGGRRRLDLDRLAVADDAADDEVLALDEALQRLERHNGPCAELVKLRFFAGLTMAEAAAALGVAPRTAHRYWVFARAWLHDALRQD